MGLLNPDRLLTTTHASQLIRIAQLATLGNSYWTFADPRPLPLNLCPRPLPDLCFLTHSDDLRPSEMISN